MIRCPVCKEPTGQYTEEPIPGKLVKVDYQLYQFSYKGQHDYLPPRCLKCYERFEARREAKISGGGSDAGTKRAKF